MKLPPMSSGMSTRLMINALVRTTAWYSRAAMVSILRTGALLQFGGGDADEYVVQRRPGQLKVPDLAARHQRCQQLLCVGVTGEAEFLEPAEIRHLDDAWQIG